MTPAQTNWSEEEDKRLLRAWLAEEPPKTVREIADELGKSKSAVYRRIKTYDAHGHKGDRELYERIYGVKLDPAIKPVRVETDAMPSGKTEGIRYSVLAWSDVHYPFHDEQAVDVLYQVAEAEKPDKLYCLGDIFDFWRISDYRPPKNPDKDFQETLNLGVKHLAKMVELAEPNEARFWAGNHEDRWDRMMLKARNDVRFRQLLKIPKIKRSLQFEEVAGFSELGYEYYPYVEADVHAEKDRLVFTHGEHANKYVARKMMDVYGKNVLFGHAHSIQSFTRRDMKGQKAGFCIGCLCDLDPHYDNTISDWQHGFALIDFAEVDGEWLFDVNQIRIHDGKAVVNEKVFEAGV